MGQYKVSGHLQKALMVTCMRVLQRNRTSRVSLSIIYLSIIYYNELTHTIMEAEKSHDLPSASWRPGKLVVQFPSESTVLRTKKADDVSSSPTSNLENSQEKRENSPFFLCRLPIDWMKSISSPCPLGEGDLLYVVYPFKCESYPETPSQTHPN